MTTEERVLVEDILLEYKSLVDYLKSPPHGNVLTLDYNEILRREAKIDGIRQSLSSIIKCTIIN